MTAKQRAAVREAQCVFREIVEQSLLRDIKRLLILQLVTSGIPKTVIDRTLGRRESEGK